MADQARVTSTDALESFRVSLLVFLTKAHRSVDAVSDEIRRTRVWLQHDQRVHWEQEFRRRSKALERAEQELFSAQLDKNNAGAVQTRQAAVNRAKHAIEEAEQKRRHVKKWNQSYDNCVDPLAKRLENLGQFLDHDLPKAIAYLANIQRAIDAYATDAPSLESLPEPAPLLTASTEPEAAP